MSTHATNFYADFQGMAGLRSRAQSNPQEVLKEVAGQFEALFLEQVMKSMRSASLGEGMFDSDQTKTFQEMWDKQLAKDLSSNGRGLGLADMLVRQLGGQGAAPRSPDRGHAVRQAIGVSAGVTSGESADAVAESTPEAASGATRRVAERHDDWRPESPEAFIRELWPRAQGAAAELGVAPEVLVAQAALETGWGRSVSRDADGSSSHNLFNIKADRRWDGDSVNISTLEYRDGVAVRERAAFRAYGSFEESFGDYVAFLRENPRYGDALANAGDPHAFVRELQEAGYATDPNYASKIGSILARDEMRQNVAALKGSSDAPIT